VIVTVSADEIIDALAIALDPTEIDVEDYAGVFHEGEVPPKAGPRRVVVGAAGEPSTTRRGLSQPSLEQIIAIRCWGETFGEAFELFRAVHEALSDTLLPLATHKMTSAEFGRTTDFPDPDPEIRMHVVVGEYRTRTIAL
jgi:hypothetical protein